MIGKIHGLKQLPNTKMLCIKVKNDLYLLDHRKLKVTEKIQNIR